MERALELAAKGLYTTDPNPRVGCVLVRAGEVVGEGWHARAGEPHAEVLALRHAGARAQGATAYVTLEPCSHTGRTPPCADALIAAGIERVVCAVGDPNPKVSGGGIARLRDAGIAVTVGPGGDRARALNAGFFLRFEHGRPLVRLKLAMSLDGRTAPAGGGLLWITGEAARADVQHWRAQSSAVLTGAGTVRVDDPRLDVRLEYGPWVRQPLRVVLDPDGRCPPSAAVYKDGNALAFVADDGQDAGATGAAAKGADAKSTGNVPPAAVARVRRGACGLDLQAVLAELAAREVNELLVECGPRLAASFLEERLVDELIVYVAPSLLGRNAQELTALEGPAAAAALARFEFRDHRVFAPDLRLILTPKRE